MIKRCGHCGEKKEHGRNRSQRDGAATECKDCANAYQKQYRKDNAERLVRYHAIYDATHKPERRAKGKRYRLANPDKIRTHLRDWREANAEHVAAHSAAYRQEHAKEINARSAAWRSANPAQYAALRAARRARKRSARSDSVPAMAAWMSLLKLTACEYCGGPYEVLEHMTPLSRGGSHTILNTTGACALCNGNKLAKIYPDEWVTRPSDGIRGNITNENGNNNNG